MTENRSAVNIAACFAFLASLLLLLCACLSSQPRKSVPPPRFATEEGFVGKGHFVTGVKDGCGTMTSATGQVQLVGEPRKNNGLAICYREEGDVVVVTAFASFSPDPNDRKEIGTYRLRLNDTVVLNQIAEPWSIKLVTADRIPPPPPDTCMKYSGGWPVWVIWCLPMLLALLAWAWLFYQWHSKRPALALLIATALYTVAAAEAAGGTLYLTYFACVPSSTPWQFLPEYKLDGYVMLLSFPSLIAGIVALARGPSRWVSAILSVMSVWLLGFSFLHALTI